MLPLITRRSSTRFTPRVFVGKSGSIFLILDAIDALDMDREDDDSGGENGDAEPSHGATHALYQTKAWRANFPSDDLEFEGDTVADCDREERHDREHDEAEISGIGDAGGLDKQRDGERGHCYSATWRKIAELLWSRKVSPKVGNASGRRRATPR